MLKHGIKGRNISILSPRKWENSCASRLNQGRFYKSHKTDIQELSDKAELLMVRKATGKIDSICFSTIHSFKGLENSYIILTDITKIDDDEFRSLLYVGMSRARIGLYVLIDESVRNEYDSLVKKGVKKT